MSNIFFSDLLERHEMAELIASTGAGFETIWFSVADNLDRFEHSIGFERERQASFGHPDLIVHGPFLDLNPMTFDSCIRQVTMERFNQAFDAARMLGARKVVYHSGMIPSVYFLQGWAQRMVAFWNEFMEGKSGVQVCMENVLDREIEPFAEVVQGVDSDCFGICLDVGHAHCYSNHDVREWALGLGASIKHVHVHDNDSTCDAHRGLGWGSIDWESVVSAIASQNADATWTIECARADEARGSFRVLQRLVPAAYGV